jgi:hypothetical protein
MTSRRPLRDSRLAAARYQVDRAIPRTDEESSAGPARDEAETDSAGQTTMEAREQYVEIAVQQSIRRGDFDQLPGAGKPLKNLHQVHDPDWWIRQKIEREGLTGLGPPALTLRTENASLDARLDALTSEGAVREALEDFNARVVEARRQLQGGPPVVTPTREVDEEVRRWHERRAARAREAEEERRREAAAQAAMTWRERRRARRGR